MFWEKFPKEINFNSPQSQKIKMGRRIGIIIKMLLNNGNTLRNQEDKVKKRPVG